MSKKRRQYSNEQKVSVVREHLLEQVPISEVCDKHEISPAMFYQWQKTSNKPSINNRSRLIFQLTLNQYRFDGELLNLLPARSGR